MKRFALVVAVALFSLPLFMATGCTGPTAVDVEEQGPYVRSSVKGERPNQPQTLRRQRPDNKKDQKSK